MRRLPSPRQLRNSILSSSTPPRTNTNAPPSPLCPSRPHRSGSTQWGMTSALAQFVIMGIFVQGFWFGSKLVRIVSQFPAQPPTNHPNKMLQQERNCSILNEGKTYSRHSAYNEPYTSEVNDSYQRRRQDVGKKIGGLDK